MMNLPSELIKRKDWWGLGRLLDSLLMPRPTDRHSFQRSRRTATQTIATGGYASLQFTGTERVDNYFHTTSDSTKFTAKVTGPHLFGCHVTLESNSTGRRGIRVRHNTVLGVGTTIAILEMPAINGADHPLSISTMWYMLADEWVTFDVYQDSGGNLLARSSGGNSSEGWAMYLAPNRQ